MSAAEIPTRAHFQAMLDRASEAVPAAFGADLRAGWLCAYERDPKAAAGFVSRALTPATAEGLADEAVRFLARDRVVDWVRRQVASRQGDRGDGLDHVRLDGVRLPAMVFCGDGPDGDMMRAPMKHVRDATLLDLRTHAQIARRHPTSRRVAKTWLAIADRMAAAGAGQDEKLPDAAARLRGGRA